MVLTKKSNQKELTIDPGEKIKVYKSEYYFLKGKLSLVDSTSIAVEKDTIPLAEIVSIEAKTIRTKKTGIRLTTAGIVTTVLGSLLIADSNNQDEIELAPLTGTIGIVFVVGGAGMTTFGVFSLVNGKKYNGKSWEFSVRRLEHTME